MHVVGIALAVWLTRRRWRTQGGDPDLVDEVGLWGVPAGIVGGRLSLRSAATGSLVFVPGDVVKGVIAAAVAVAVRRAYPVDRPRRAPATP